MKLKEYKTEYGSIRFWQFGYPDLITPELQELLTKEQAFKHINPNSVKNNIKKAKFRVCKYLYRLLWEVIIDFAMEGNIVHLPYGTKVFIGVIDRYSKKKANLHTDGKVYGLKIITNKAHTYKFRMPQRRRLELQQRILKGQKFHS